MPDFLCYFVFLYKKAGFPFAKRNVFQRRHNFHQFKMLVNHSYSGSDCVLRGRKMLYFSVD